VSRSADFRRASLRLGDSMRSNIWDAGGRQIDLGRIVRACDRSTRQDDFHVLHDWDGKADKVNRDTIPLDVLNFLIRRRGADPPDTRSLAILVDYYFVHLLALLSLRGWDEGDADEHLDRLNEMLRQLQGPNGSGQRFVDDAETLILIATSHFELVEVGYAKLLDRVRSLNASHRAHIAKGHAVSMGSHLRFGFEATYGRDTVAMRDDNVADYPWLCFALLTMMREYARMHDDDVRGPERERTVEALLNGLSPDPRAFIGQPPASLSATAASHSERLEFAELFRIYQDELTEEFERHRPSDRFYSPLSLFFNFSQNILKGTVVDALLRGEPWEISFNDLLTGVPGDDPKGALKQTLARTLMGYARDNPDTIGGRLMPVIVYDPSTGHEAFTVAMRKMRQ